MVARKFNSPLFITHTALLCSKKRSHYQKGIDKSTVHVVKTSGVQWESYDNAVEQSKKTKNISAYFLQVLIGVSGV